MTAINPLLRFLSDVASRQLNASEAGASDDLLDLSDDRYRRANRTDGIMVGDVPTSAPSSSPTTTAISRANGQQTVGYIVVSILFAILLLSCFCCYTMWKQRRERNFMDYVNTRADSVLGDMVMVPTDYNEEDDEDGYEGEMI